MMIFANGKTLTGQRSAKARPQLFLALNVVPGVQERSERSERAEQCSEHSWACSGHVAKISMLRLNIGSGKLSSCMLSIGRGPKAVQGKGGLPPLALFAFGCEANAEHA